MTAGTVWGPKAAALTPGVGAVTSITRFGDNEPNEPVPACCICHWRLYVPGAAGAVSWMEKVVSAPAATAPGSGAEFTPQRRLSAGFCEPSVKPFAGLHGLRPMFRTVTEAVKTAPVVTDAGAVWARNSASLSGVPTVITRLGERSPKNSTPSCTMRHWKLNVPATTGAKTRKLKVASAPTGTGFGNGARATPQVKLSGGFCDARLYKPACDHGLAPVLRSTTWTS